MNDDEYQKSLDQRWISLEQSFEDIHKSITELVTRLYELNPKILADHLTVEQLEIIDVPVEDPLDYMRGILDD